MAKEKLNNLIGYGDFSKKIYEKPSKTKRTEIGKDILKESHIDKDDMDGQKEFICSVASEVDKEILEEIFCTFVDELDEGETYSIYNRVEGVLKKHGLYP
jgi:hypothetical protein